MHEVGRTGKLDGLTMLVVRDKASKRIDGIYWTRNIHLLRMSMMQDPDTLEYLQIDSRTSDRFVDHRKGRDVSGSKDGVVSEGALLGLLNAVGTGEWKGFPKVGEPDPLSGRSA